MDTQTEVDARYTDRVIRCRLPVLLALKAERDNKKKYTIREVATATGLSTNVVQRYMGNDFDRIDKSTVDKLCRFLGCGVGDLLVYEEAKGA